MNDVVVIGGGVSGLAIAHDLMVNGHDVTLLERQVHIGGNARSLRQDGFLMELGPTTMNPALPGMSERLDELNLNTGRLPLGPRVKKRYLADQGRLSGISTNPARFLLSNYLSLGGRIRMMAELLVPGARMTPRKASPISSAVALAANSPNGCSNRWQPVYSCPIRSNCRCRAPFPASPVATCFFAYRRTQVAHPLDGLGFLSTRSGGIISGAQFPSTMFAGRAPDGFVSISAYLGGARRADLAVLPARDLLPLVEQELKDLLGLKGAPVIARAHHWPIGLPHYTLGHAARRAVLEATPERLPGLYLTGNYLSGVSLSSCLEQAKSVAGRLKTDRKSSLNQHNPPLSGIPVGIQSAG